MRVAIYARVSTANNGRDPTMQTRELREYVDRRGWQLAGDYVDVGISGTKEKRPSICVGQDGQQDKTLVVRRVGQALSRTRATLHAHAALIAGVTSRGCLQSTQ
jgi:DNA invertase Pin-like site-specific DNA recombinase